MHRIDKAHYSQLLREACRMDHATPGVEICGLLVNTGHHLTFVQTRNILRRPGGFALSPVDVRRIVAAAAILGQEVVGTFHSHPAAPATPGKSDIEHAVDDSLMFLFDCIGKEGRLWKIKKGRARPLRVDFLDKQTS